jgi:seryl-tRNA synthetase
MTDPFIALAAALFGGAGLKIIESLLNKSNAKNDLQTQMRSELRTDVISLKDELDEIESRLDEWKKKYYRLFFAFNELAVVALAAGLEEEVARIREDVEDL